MRMDKVAGSGSSTGSSSPIRYLRRVTSRGGLPQQWTEAVTSHLSRKSWARSTGSTTFPMPNGTNKLLCTALLLLLAACGSPAPDPAQAYIDRYGGSLVAIEFILGYTDCDTLQRTYDAALSNASAFGMTTARGSEQRGRLAAAEDRMTELDC